MKLKKFLSLMLALIMVCSLAVPVAFGEDIVEGEVIGDGAVQDDPIAEEGTPPVECEHEWVYERIEAPAIEDSEETETPDAKVVAEEAKGEEKDEEIAEPIVSHKKTCTKCGAEEIEACAGCCYEGCALCKGELIDTHIDADEDSHCDVCFFAIDHEDEMRFDEEYHWYVCPVNEDKELTLKMAHLWVNPVVVDPTCEEQGYSEQSCRECDATKKSDFVDELGHDWSDWEVVKEATMTEEGEQSRECSVCEKVETEKIEKIPHVCAPDSKLYDVVDPTCESKGFSGNKRCTVCQKILEPGKIVDALGHKEVKVKKVEPTCRKDGKEEGLECEVCKKVLKEGKTIAKLGHKYPDKANNDGKFLCERCGHDKESPETGDATSLMFWGILMAASLVAAAGFVLSEKKRTQVEE